MTEPVIAVQIDAQPTNKVSASSTIGGGIGAAVSVVMVTYIGPAIQEVLAGYPVGPNLTALIIAVVTAVAGYFATKYSGQAAAYNVLDKPNVPMVAAPSPTLPVTKEPTP